MGRVGLIGVGSYDEVWAVYSSGLRTGAMVGQDVWAVDGEMPELARLVMI